MKLLPHERERTTARLRWLKDNLNGAVLCEAWRDAEPPEPHTPRQEFDDDVETLLEEETEEALRIAVAVFEGRLTL